MNGLVGRFVKFFFFQAENGIRDTSVTGVQTCALPICCLIVSDFNVRKVALTGHKRYLTRKAIVLIELSQIHVANPLACLSIKPCSPINLGLNSGGNSRGRCGSSSVSSRFAKIAEAVSRSTPILCRYVDCLRCR